MTRTSVVSMKLIRQQGWSSSDQRDQGLLLFPVKSCRATASAMLGPSPEGSFACLWSLAL